MFSDTEFLLAGSEELSREFNSLGSYYSDIHKEVYGFRPREMALCACDYADHQSLVIAMTILKNAIEVTERAQ